jgi:hypothetical protein
MTLSIQLPEIPEESIDRLDRAAYIHRLIERDLLPPDPRMTFEEILAPAHAAAHGMPEDELEKLVTEEVDAARRERRAPPNRAQ